MNRNFLIAIIIGLLFFLGIGLYFGFGKSFSEKSYENQMTSQFIEVFKIYQDSYRKEFKAFNRNKNELIQYLTLTENARGYIDISDIPDALNSKIPENEMPFINENSYKIILILNDRNDALMGIFSFDNLGILKKLFP